MESAATLPSVHCTSSHLWSVFETSMVPVHNVAWPKPSKSPKHSLNYGGKLPSSLKRQEKMVISCVKASETAEMSKSDFREPNGALKSDSSSHGTLKKNFLQASRFPNGFEDLILEVCDHTKVAELKLKVGDFEMHLKRNTEAAQAPVDFVSPTSPPPSSPVPSQPMTESAPGGPPQSPPKSSTEKVSPFINVTVEKPTKLAALEATGATGYVIVSSPRVGSFRRGRTFKGKRQPPICKEGDVIKEGQVIGYLDQFGTELPVKSDVTGEILKIIFDDGEAVGYGCPLVAVLPSFHDINIK